MHYEKRRPFPSAISKIIALPDCRFYKSNVFMNEFTLILNDAAQGNDRSAEALLPLVYEELRKLAHARMAGRMASHTLQPTALVHEAWLRMVDDAEQTWHNRAYFFSSASTAMRNILIDHARKKSAIKHGGGQQRIDVSSLELASDEPDEMILRVDAALQRLEQVNPKWGRIVVMKYFGGMTNKEVAEAMDMGESTIERYWSGAKSWLYQKITEQE